MPELRGPLRLPRRRPRRREWATPRGRYRVRVGWHSARISDNLLDLLLLVDGRHTVAEIADELERRQGRPVHVAEVAYMLRERLGAAGIVRLRRGSLIASSVRPSTRATATAVAVQSSPPVAAVPSVQAVASQPLELADAPQYESATVPLLDESATVTPTAPSLPGALALPSPGSVSEEENLPSLGEIEASDDAVPASAAPARNGHDTRHADLPAPPSAAAGTQDDDPATDEPTLVLPRDDAPRATADAPDRAPRMGTAALSLAALTAAGTHAVAQRAAPITRQMPAVGGAVARTRPRMSRRLALQVAGLAVLVILLGLAMHSNVGGLFNAITAIRPTPTLAPTATATPPQERILPGETAYLVHSGDTLSAIAAREHISADALALVNADVLGSSDPSGALVPGTRLAIPAVYQPGVPAAKQPRPLYYTLRPGDTLYVVGQLFGVDWHTIATYNHITDQYTMPVGLGIIIPAHS